MHGAGLDEISPLGPSKIIEIKNTASEGQPKQYETKEFILDPKEYGFPGCTMEDLRGGERDENARLLREALGGGTWDKNGKKDAIALNAGIGLYVYGMAPTIEASFELARRTLESGAALTQVCARLTVRLTDALLRLPMRANVHRASRFYVHPHVFYFAREPWSSFRTTVMLNRAASLRPPQMACCSRFTCHIHKWYQYNVKMVLVLRLATRCWTYVNYQKARVVAISQ